MVAPSEMILHACATIAPESARRAFEKAISSPEKSRRPTDQFRPVIYRLVNLEIVNEFLALVASRHAEAKGCKAEVVGDCRKVPSSGNVRLYNRERTLYTTVNGADIDLV